MRTLHFVVPDSVDDPARPTGGNVYDRRVARGLRSLGWSVHEHPVPGSWPTRDPQALGALSRVIEPIPDDAVALVDGLVASAAADVLVGHTDRLQLVMLVHMPLGHRPTGGAAEDIRTREGAVLEAAAAVITTSEWSRRRLLELYPLAADRIHVAEPGVDAAELATGSEAGSRLLCVAAVIPEKGHDILLEALRTVSDLSWRCACVGRVDRDPAFVEALRRRSLDVGLEDRVDLVGPRIGAELDRCYADADLLVLASRAETFGMVITEALAHGLPVVAAEVGGVSEALGYGAEGARPGLLVAPDDPAALGAAVRRWLSEGRLRGRLRRQALRRRDSLRPWSRTAAVLAGALGGAFR
ncbi:MAG TPA: glycosyltransferase family 4 protein [Solirubrobacteraceae bacterium]|nr:glycosyltransferase family 4 protein [Solirubrobacteraceae bacterium]